MHPNTIRAIAYLAVWQLSLIVFLAISRELGVDTIAMLGGMSTQVVLSAGFAVSALIAFRQFDVRNNWQRVAVTVLGPVASMLLYAIALPVLAFTGALNLVAHVASDLTISDAAVGLLALTGLWLGVRAARARGANVPSPWLAAALAVPLLLLPLANAAMYAVVVLLALAPGLISNGRAPSGAAFAVGVSLFAFVMAGSVEVIADRCEREPYAHGCDG